MMHPFGAPRGWGAVTVHDRSDVAELWHHLALMRMTAQDFEGARRAVRAEVNISWRPGWRWRGRP
jgi:hypothetical protein